MISKWSAADLLYVAKGSKKALLIISFANIEIQVQLTYFQKRVNFDTENIGGKGKIAQNDILNHF